MFENVAENVLRNIFDEIPVLAKLFAKNCSKNCHLRGLRMFSAVYLAKFRCQQHFR